MDISRGRSTNICTFLAAKDIWLIIAVCITVVLGTHNNIFSYFAFLLSIAGIFFLSDENSLCLLMFMMPFANIFKSAPGTQSFFTYLILFYVFYNTIKKHKINTNWLLSMISLVIFLIVQAAISVNILRSVKFIVNLFMIYFATTLKTKDDNKKVFLFYIWGIVISSSAALLNVIPNLSSYVIEKKLGYAYEGIMRFAGLYADPNYYAVNLIISLCLIVILNHNKKLSTIPAITLATILIFFVVLTYSKSAFLMLILPLFMLLYSKIKKRKYFILLVILIVGAIFIINVFIGENKIEALNIVLSRFQNSEDLSSLTTGRWAIWMNYSYYLQNSNKTLLIGRGFGAELLGGRAAHNTYLDVLYYLGIVGTTLLLITFFMLMRTGKLQIKRNFLNHSIWLCVLIMYFFLSELFYFDWAFHVIIAMLVSKTDCMRIQEG